MKRASRPARLAGLVAAAQLLWLCGAVAAQQVSCDDLDTVVASAKHNFSSLKGSALDRSEGMESYLSRVFLPSADRCTIEYLDGEGQYKCRFRFASPSDANAGASKIEQWVAACAGTPTFGQAGRYKGPKSVIFSRYKNGRGDYELTVLPTKD